MEFSTRYHSQECTVKSNGRENSKRQIWRTGPGQLTFMSHASFMKRDTDFPTFLGALPPKLLSIPSESAWLPHICPRLPKKKKQMCPCEKRLYSLGSVLVWECLDGATLRTFLPPNPVGLILIAPALVLHQFISIDVNRDIPDLTQRENRVSPIEFTLHRLSVWDACKV